MRARERPKIRARSESGDPHLLVPCRPSRRCCTPPPPVRDAPLHEIPPVRADAGRGAALRGRNGAGEGSQQARRRSVAAWPTSGDGARARPRGDAALEKNQEEAGGGGLGMEDATMDCGGRRRGRRRGGRRRTER
uniref:Uncharacterized protein n=1 Tax=Setaria viridis TaxID=4556 RepID=A0A4U6UPJ9_SETVI|nr:hypothetical protein SEVIR_5G293050v2 [Setaria viridis]